MSERRHFRLPRHVARLVKRVESLIESHADSEERRMLALALKGGRRDRPARWRYSVTAAFTRILQAKIGTGL
jgi:hypothetical protein